MSCLTRTLQKKLMQYLQSHAKKVHQHKPETIRRELVNKGMCPSDVTTDQFRFLCKQATGQA